MRFERYLKLGILLIAKVREKEEKIEKRRCGWLVAFGMCVCPGRWVCRVRASGVDML